MLKADLTAALLPHLLDLLVDVILPLRYLLQGQAALRVSFRCLLDDGDSWSCPGNRRRRGEADGDEGAVGEPLPVLHLGTVILLPGTETPVTRETFHLVEQEEERYDDNDKNKKNIRNDNNAVKDNDKNIDKYNYIED